MGLDEIVWGEMYKVHQNQGVPKLNQVKTLDFNLELFQPLRILRPNKNKQLNFSTFIFLTIGC